MQLASTGKRLTLLIGLAAAVAACMPVGDPPPADAPVFPGYPPIAQYAGSQCHTVLLVGDSLITPAGSAVASTLDASGRCATVVNEARNGTAPVGDLQGYDWQQNLPNLIEQHDPSVLVIEFVGNGFTETNGDAWLAELQQGLLDLAKIGTDAGVKTYVAIPPDVSSYPLYNLIGMNRFIAWQRNADLGAPKIDVGPVLSPTGWSAWLRFPDGIQRVRNDFVHLSDLGASISGYVVAAGVQHEWSTTTTAP